MMSGAGIIWRYPHTLAVGAGQWPGLHLAADQNIYIGPVPVWHSLGFHILVASYSGVCLYIRLRPSASNLLKRDIHQNKISTLNMAKHGGGVVKESELLNLAQSTLSQRLPKFCKW